MKGISVTATFDAVQQTLGSAGCQPAVAGSLPATLSDVWESIAQRTVRTRLGKLPRRAGWSNYSNRSQESYRLDVWSDALATPSNPDAL